MEARSTKHEARSTGGPRRLPSRSTRARRLRLRGRVWLELTTQGPIQHATPWTHGHNDTRNRIFHQHSMHGDSLQSPGHQPLLKTAVQDGTMCATTPAAPASRGRLRLAGGWLARSQLGSLPEDTPPSSAMLDSDGDLHMPNGNAGPRVGQDLGRLMMTGSGQTCRHGRQ